MTDKLCPKCGQRLSLEYFSRQKNGRIASYCKPCTSEYCKQHYALHREEHNKRRYRNSKRYIQRNRAYTVDYLRNHPCVDCGERNLLFLEFDHVAPTDKRHLISELSRTGCSLRQLIEEIAKCEVRCVHCHRRRTARQFGWAKGILSQPGM